MTRTEDRLTDALAARAAAVREDSLRPLIADELGLLSPARVGRDQQRRGWHAILAPLAAAAAMVLVIGGTIVAVRELHGATSAPFADVATAHAPPPYYVKLDYSATLTVHATSTGQVTDRLLPPYPRFGPSEMRLENALAAAANGRTFVVVYDDDGTGVGPFRTGIYTFTLTSDGRIADFRRVRDGVLPGLARMSAAVSPDGSEVAIAGASMAAAENAERVQSTKIVVVNLRTGRQVIFEGGMDRRGQQFGISDVSWANDGQSLVYLAQWCRQLIIDRTTACWANLGRPVTELRMISATGDGGPLSGGQTLLRDSPAYPSILQALASPDDRSIVAMTERGSEISVVRFDLRTGAPIAVLYRRRAAPDKSVWGGGGIGACLSSDGTGQYLFFDEDLGTVDGWIHDGRFHPTKKIGFRNLNETVWAGPAW